MVGSEIRAKASSLGLIAVAALLMLGCHERFVGSCAEVQQCERERSNTAGQGGDVQGMAGTTQQAVGGSNGGAGGTDESSSATGGMKGEIGAGAAGLPDSGGGQGGNSEPSETSGGAGGELVGGAAGQANGGAAGNEGGKPCNMDQECDDHLACTGIEHCTNHNCELGTAVQCALTHECVEQSSGAKCLSKRESTWFVYNANSEQLEVYDLYAVNVRLGVPYHPINISKLVGRKPTTSVSDYGHWSPDGRLVSFCAYTNPGETPDIGLHTVDLSGAAPSEPKLIASVPDHIVWSSEWKSLYTQSRESILIFRWKGPMLLGDPIPVKPGQRTIPWPWSPAGSYLAYTNSAETSAGDLFVVDTAQSEDLKPIALGVRSLSHSLLFSPDAKWIAFHKDKTTLHVTRFSSAADMSATLQVAEDNNGYYHFNYEWAPNSQFIAYTAMNATKEQSILLLDLKALPQSRELVSNASIRSTPSNKSWSPDSLSLLYYSGNGGAYLYRLESGKSEFVDQGVAEWSNTGRYLHVKNTTSPESLRELRLYENADGKLSPVHRLHTLAPTERYEEVLFAPDDSGCVVRIGSTEPGNYLQTVGYIDLRNGPQSPSTALVKLTPTPTAYPTLAWSSGAGFIAMSVFANNRSESRIFDVTGTTPQSELVIGSYVMWQPSRREP